MESFLARQPIFDIREDVKAYEILYRSGYQNKFTGRDGDESSQKVLFNTFQTFGIDNLTKGRPVFINFTEGLICDEMATLFSNEILVVEILEDVLPKDTIIERTRALKRKGYKIALDDFVYSPEYEILLDIVDIVKVDFMELGREEIEKLSVDLKKRDIELLAEKVETREDYEYAKSLGFTLFQGYFFSEPEIMVSRQLEPMKASYLELLAEANKRMMDFDNIAKIISRDLALTYNLLKLVNSSAFGFRYKIESVKHGVVALGQRQMKKWIYLIMVNTVGKGESNELTKLSLVRARFIELIALKTRYRNKSQELFLIGLLSLLDSILMRPLDGILEELHVGDRVRDALVDSRGEYFDFYKIILAYEAGEWDKFIKYAERLNISPSLVSESYLEAILWCNKLQTPNT